MNTTELKASVIEDIKAGMRIAGIDQAMLAERINTSVPYVSKILNKEQNFSIETLDEITKALGLRLKIEMHL